MDTVADVTEGDITGKRVNNMTNSNPGVGLATAQMDVAPKRMSEIDPALCPVEVAARIIGQKWTLQIVKTLLSCRSQRFCELQEALGGVNPSTLSSRLKMLEDEGMISRKQVSAIPPHVEYSLTDMGCDLKPVIQAISYWSRDWLCTAERLRAAEK